MKRIWIIVFALILSAAPTVALAEVCLTDDGFVVPCPPTGPQPVQGHWGSVPSTSGVPVGVYIYGGSNIAPESELVITLNDQFFCASSSVGNATPIRHCTGTIASPGTYVMKAYRLQGNFLPPQPIVLNIVAP